jgi:predicted ATPase
MAIATEQGFSFWHAGGLVMRGRALAGLGSGSEGVAQLRDGLAAWADTGSETYRTYYQGLLAEVLGEQGRIEEALRVLDDALALVQRTGERFHEAELHRLKGEFLLRQGAPPDDAEQWFREAAALARREQSRALDLRAALSLGRLLRQRGQPEEARQAVAEVFGGFTEGLDTPDLCEARAFLDA